MQPMATTNTSKDTVNKQQQQQDPSSPNGTRPKLNSKKAPALLHPDALRKARRTRHAAPSSVLPKRRDSSIGATSTNPRVLQGSVFNSVSPARQRRTPVDFNTAESKAALYKLRTIFLPVLMRVILRRRRRAAVKGPYPPRQYTAESVVGAMRSSKSLLASWPLSILHLLAQEAIFSFPRAKETIVYRNESHLSSGIVVLLHGQLVERRAKESGKGTAAAAADSATAASATDNRPIRSQRSRIRYAPDVLCALPVLCEDRSLTSLSSSSTDPADVATIPSRVFWYVYNKFVIESPEADMVLDSFREQVNPQRTEMLLASYYATSVTLQRSWVWHFLSSSDRVKLVRGMEVKVLGIGDILFEEGAYSPYLYVLRRGTLTIVVKGEPLAIVEPGTAFGEESIIFNDPRNSTVVAGTVCELYALHMNELHHRFGKYPELAHKVVNMSLERRTKWLEAGRKRDIFGLVSVLSGVPCLSHTTDAMRESIAASATLLTIPAGQRVVTKDTPCQSLYIIGRGCVRMGGITDPNRPYLCLAHAGENISVGDFFGELCLRPHLWPQDAVAASSLDVWVVSRSTMLEVLSTVKADVQALEVCRQGMALYRKQKGEGSITEGFDPPLPPPRKLSRPPSGSKVPTSRRTSLASSTVLHGDASTSSATKKRRMSGSGEITSAKQFKDFDWVAYVKSRQEATPDERAVRATHRELRDADREIEKALKPKVRTLISVGLNEMTPAPADCDFPADATELQAIIVEQLLLTPSEEQPRFLRQVNNSNVKLVTDEGNANNNFQATMSLANPDPAMDGTTTTTLLNNTTNIGEVAMEDLAGKETFFSVGVNPLEHLPSDDVNGQSLHSGEQEDLLSFESGSAVGSPFNPSRRYSGVEDSQSGITSSQPFATFRTSLNRSLLVRPPSAATTPRANNHNNNVNNSVLLNDLVSPRSSIMRPISSEPQRVSSSVPRVRPQSVDFSSQVKLSVERSSTMLDRYVKIEDQNYFNNFVSVLPLQQEVLDDDMGNSLRPASILMLMHVKGCDYLVPEAMISCAKPIVKVFTGSRELVRTPPMDNRRNPSWSVDASSCIGFIRRGEEISFIVCDSVDVQQVVYQCTLSTDEIHENGGVGEMALKLYNPDEEDDGNSGSGSPPPAHTPRVIVTIMAVTASNYKGIHEHLNSTNPIDEAMKLEQTAAPQNAEEDDDNVAYVQIIGMEGLQHRIEASVTVSMETDGAIRKLLETPRVTPKTRTPSWPANAGFARLSGDGYVTFSLSHRSTRIASCDTTVSDFVFCGTGVRRLPMYAGSGNDVIGDLLVYVLGASSPAQLEDIRAQSAVFLTIESFTAAEKELPLTPDPFVIVRGPDGVEVLRTPLGINTYKVTWTSEEASCLLACPTLTGSGASYTITVHDGSEQSPSLGSATFTLTHEGLGPHHRYDIPMEGGKGTVRVQAHCLPIQRPPGAAGGEYDAVANAAHFMKDDPLVLVHMAGCAQLPGWEDEKEGEAHDPFLKTDAVATLTVAEKEYVRTPVHSSCAPKWAMRHASALLRLRPEDTRETVVFEVFDGLVDEVDKIGEARTLLADLCCTRKHYYDIHTAEALDATMSFVDMPSMATLGKCEVHSYVVKLGAQVVSNQYGLLGKDSQYVASTTSQRKKEKPPHIRLSLTTLCNLAPLLDDDAAPDHPIQVVVKISAQKHVVLQVSRTLQTGEVLVFDAADGTALLNVNQLKGDAAQIEVLVCRQGRQTPSPVMGSTGEDAVCQPSMVTLTAAVPFDILSGATGKESVQVYTATLHQHDGSSSSKKGSAARSDGRPPSTPKVQSAPPAQGGSMPARLATLSMGISGLMLTEPQTTATVTA